MNGMNYECSSLNDVINKYLLIMRLTYIIHIANYPIFHSILSKLNHNKIIENDAYINICQDLITPSQEIIIKGLCNKLFKKCIFFNFENKGQDVGPFLKIIKYFIDNNITYDLIFKIHTKTQNDWRNDLLNPFIENDEKIKFLFESIPDLGVMGSQYWMFLLDNLNTNNITNFSNKHSLNLKPYANTIDEKNIDVLSIKKYNGYFYNSIIKCFGEFRNDVYLENDILDWLIDNRNVNTVVNKNNRPDEIYYVAGTIFIIRFDIIKNFIEKYDIDLDEEYEKMENGYITNDNETWVHSWERILSGLIVKEMGYSWMGV